MTHPPEHPFNPCESPEDEPIAAKIWELLRRNKKFQGTVTRLRRLDDKARSTNRSGPEWKESCDLVGDLKQRHPFAGVALQWLVPEPLFQVHEVTWPRGKKWKERPVFSIRFLQVCEGTTPDATDGAHSVSRKSDQPDIAGHPMRRGPEVSWTKSRSKRLRSKANPILEWKRYPWPFTVEHSWREAPAQFRREFQFIWRERFDCRPRNSITKDRTDSPSPHETSFFQDWKLTAFRASGQGTNLTREDLSNVIRFDNLARGYRVFAIPKTILTKGAANAMGNWLADELKKGSNLYGDLLKSKLLNEGELFGTTSEWRDWLAHKAKQTSSPCKDSHFYRRCHYMDSLVSLIYPAFDLARLLAPPKHRARGKKYSRKGGQK